MDEPPHLPLADGLDETRREAVAVVATSAPELVTTREREVAASAPPRAGEVVGTEEELGYDPALSTRRSKRASPGAPLAEAAQPERRVCPMCSVPNPASRDTCMACGQRL